MAGSRSFRFGCLCWVHLTYDAPLFQRISKRWISFAMRLPRLWASLPRQAGKEDYLSKAGKFQFPSTPFTTTWLPRGCIIPKPMLCQAFFVFCLFCVLFFFCFVFSVPSPDVAPPRLSQAASLPEPRHLLRGCICFQSSVLGSRRLPRVQMRNTLVPSVKPE